MDKLYSIFENRSPKNLFKKACRGGKIKVVESLFDEYGIDIIDDECWENLFLYNQFDILQKFCDNGYKTNIKLNILTFHCRFMSFGSFKQIKYFCENIIDDADIDDIMNCCFYGKSNFKDMKCVKIEFVTQFGNIRAHFCMEETWENIGVVRAIDIMHYYLTKYAKYVLDDDLKFFDFVIKNNICNLIEYVNWKWSCININKLSEIIYILLRHSQKYGFPLERGYENYILEFLFRYPNYYFIYTRMMKCNIDYKNKDFYKILRTSNEIYSYESTEQIIKKKDSVITFFNYAPPNLLHGAISVEYEKGLISIEEINSKK